MIVKITGKLVEKKTNALVVDVQGLAHEVLVSSSVLSRVDDHIDGNGMISLITHYYIQISPSRGIPCLVGFFNEIERDFFLDFIKVSGIGPRAAVKALDRPISEIAGAIAQQNEKLLKELPGIGGQKAKEIIAKLQNKVGKYGLIQDTASVSPKAVFHEEMPDWQQEALDVLLQLQYKKAEALLMIEKALKRSSKSETAEDLLNEIYKQRTSI
ncbi:MAG: Holliday junction branch migration protein RuvA [Candidatus Omnitrophota bacterium]